MKQLKTATAKWDTIQLNANSPVIKAGDTVQYKRIKFYNGEDWLVLANNNMTPAIAFNW